MPIAPKASIEVKPLIDCLGQPIRLGPAYLGHLKEKFDMGIALLKSHTSIEGCHVLDFKPSPKLLGYRCSAKVAVRFNPENPVDFDMGLFEPGTHKVVNTVSCPTQTASLNRLLTDIQYFIPELGIEPYDEETHSGNLRYVAARVAHRTDEVMLTLVMREPNMAQARALVTKLKNNNHILKSVYINEHTEPGNAILSQKNIKVSGADFLRESLHNLLFEISPNSFFQVNPWQAAQLYQRVKDLVGELKNTGYAWDLYSGVGQISLFLCQQGYQVLGVEEVEPALASSIRNANLNGLENQFTGICGRVEDLKAQLAQADQPDIITVNPSRRGLAPEVAGLLKNMFENRRSTQLIYVSCEMETLARDTKILLDSTLRLRQIEAFDMFPHTDKMEWVAVFTC